MTTATSTPTQMPWPVYPAADELPMMSDEALAELAKDIEANGLNEPLVLWEDNSEAPEPTEDDPMGQRETPERGWPVYLLDGRNRYVAAARAGMADVAERKVRVYQAKVITAQGWAPGVNPDAYVLTANVYRRHLSNREKAAAIKRYIAAVPRATDREVGRALGVDHKTVGKVRAEAEPEAVEHSPLDRALAYLREQGPDANGGKGISKAKLMEATGVGSGTAQRAKKEYAAELKEAEEARAARQRPAANGGGKRRGRPPRPEAPAEAVERATAAASAAAQAQATASDAALAAAEAIREGRQPMEPEEGTEGAEPITGGLTDEELAQAQAAEADPEEVAALVAAQEEADQAAAELARAREEAAARAKREREEAQEAAKLAQRRTTSERVAGRLEGIIRDAADRATKHLVAEHLPRIITALEGAAESLRGRLADDQQAEEGAEAPEEVTA